MLIGSSGAIVALGDTLFPVNSFIEGWEQKFDPAANFLVRLRWVHPLIAVGFGLYVIIVAAYYGLGNPRLKRPTQALIALVIIQLLAGSLNVLLLAPVWMQLVHLLLADAVWITLVVFSAGLLATRPVSVNEDVIVPKAITP
jgi:heme A synthase